MKIFTCAQRRCPHQVTAEQAPATCPHCGGDFGGGRTAGNGQATSNGVDWSGQTKAELLLQAECWGIEGLTSRTKKADLIAALQAAE